MRGSRSRMWGVAVVVALVAGFGLSGLAAADAPAPSGRRLITVTGSATVTARPDEAVITFGVRSEGATGTGAMKASAQKMSAVLQALADAGVDRERVETLNVSLGRTTIGRGTPGEHTVYVATNSVRATVADLSRTGAVIDAAVKAGADRVHDIRFQVSDPSEVRRRALRQAVLSSKAKADAMADAAGASVASVFSIREQESANLSAAFDQALAVAAPTPIVPEHDIEARVTVSVVWSLG